MGEPMRTGATGPGSNQSGRIRQNSPLVRRQRYAHPMSFRAPGPLLDDIRSGSVHSTAAVMFPFGELSGRTAQPGEGRVAEQGFIAAGRVIPLSTGARSSPSTSSNLLGPIPHQPHVSETKRVISRKEKAIEGTQAVTARRLLKEAQMIETNHPPGCHATPKSDDLFQWAAVIEGPSDTVYAGGTFFCDITIPPDYPFKPPSVAFLTRIYHCNISAQGDVCLDILKDAWKSTMTISTLLGSLLSLMYECNPENPLVCPIAQQYKENREEFEKMAKIWTERYAT